MYGATENVVFIYIYKKSIAVPKYVLWFLKTSNFYNYKLYVHILYIYTIKIQFL